jgi:signal transduction histidine kinase
VANTLRAQPFVLLISAICCASAGVQFWLKPDQSSYSDAWAAQFFVLLGISALLSAMLFVLAESPTTTAGLMVARMIVIGIATIPGRADIGLSATLACSCLLEAVYLLRRPYNVGIAFLCLCVDTLLLMKPVSAWGGDIPRPTVAEFVSFAFSMTLLCLIAHRHRVSLEKGAEQELRKRQLDDTVIRLMNANLGFQQYADIIQEKSTREERDRITREIHDAVGYTLINIMMMMEEASLLAGDNKALNQLHNQARAQAQSGLNETRRALRLLRSAAGGTVRTVEEITRLVTAFQKATGVSVKVEYGNIPFILQEDVGEFVIHMVKEGMANALRHGQATAIRLLFWQDDFGLIVNLHDNGIGSDHIENGIGLSGMSERLAKLGGSLRVGNMSDGFQLTARIPHPLAR